MEDKAEGFGDAASIIEEKHPEKKFRGIHVEILTPVLSKSLNSQTSPTNKE